MMKFERFQPALFEFLEQLADHNNRPWFQANKERYEQEVLEPAMTFIRAFQPRLKRISPCFVASDRRLGGSLMRVYRDTRFSKGGEPYKTNVGIQFRHEHGRDIHAPGFYVHLAPGECFLARGRLAAGTACRSLRSARRSSTGPTAGAGHARTVSSAGDSPWTAAVSNARLAASRPTILGSRISNGRTSSGWKSWRSGTYSPGASWTTWRLPSPAAVPSCGSSAML